MIYEWHFLKEYSDIIATVWTVPLQPVTYAPPVPWSPHLGASLAAQDRTGAYDASENPALSCLCLFRWLRPEEFCITQK